MMFFETAGMDRRAFAILILVFDQEKNVDKFSQQRNSVIFSKIIFELVAVFSSNIVSYIKIASVSS